MDESIFTPALARICLYVLSGWLTARGMPADLTAIVNDPAVLLGAEALIGVAIGGITFVFWRLAKRFDWRT